MRQLKELRGRRRQAGITAIGFLILAGLFGIVGYAALKLVPMYLQNMRLTTVLNGVRDELDGTGATAGTIRNAVARRFEVEGITVPRENVMIQQASNGYQLRIQYDNRTPFLADIWFLVTFDKQVEIRR
jgi:hypothetical protein